MQIHDISIAITPDMPRWPGDRKISLQQVESIDKGHLANVSHFSSSVHAGTHVDAPHHYLNNNITVEQLSLSILVGPVYVLDIPTHVPLITGEILAKEDIPAGTQRLILKTRNSQSRLLTSKKFDKDFVAVSEDGAKWLVKHGILLVGIDYLSIASFYDNFPAHDVLLKAGVIIVEGLNLSEITQGHYNLFCLPLRLVGSDGSPARVILIEN